MIVFLDIGTIKYECCRNYGIDLVTVWNNEWIHDKIKIKEELCNLIEYKKECLYDRSEF